MAVQIRQNSYVFLKYAHAVQISKKALSLIFKSNNLIYKE